MRFALNYNSTKVEQIMVVRTKPVGLRLPTRLNDRVQAFMYTNDLTFTEALTTVLERGFESIDLSTNSDIEKVDYQEQIDRLSDDLNRLTETVNKLMDKPCISTPKPKKKKVVEESISVNQIDEDFHEETNLDEVFNEPAYDQTVMEESNPSRLNDEEFSSLTGLSVYSLEHCKVNKRFGKDKQLIHNHYFDPLSELWLEVD
jgi:hypothetical protein